MNDHTNWRDSINTPIFETLQEVNQNTYLVGPLLLTRSSGPCSTATWYDSPTNSSYTILRLAAVVEDGYIELVWPPYALSHHISPNNPNITLIYECGDASAVWAIGTQIICKIHILFPSDNTTSETTTLKWLAHKSHPNFTTPEVVYSTIYDRTSILFITRLPGRTLNIAWPTLSVDCREEVVRKIVDAFRTMAKWEGDKICGVDGNNLLDNYLLSRSSEDEEWDYSPQALESSCRAIGIDCSSFVFAHTDLGPGNILVDINDDQNEDEDEKGGGVKIGIIDWESAGYVPKEWIRTKHWVSAGMVLQFEEMEGSKSGRGKGRKEDRFAYMRMLTKGLEGLRWDGHREGWWMWRDMM